METALFIAASFAVGLSGALVPGPMLTVTISDSVKKGFIAGPLVVLGHFITEIALIIIIMAGFSWVIGSTTAAILIGTLGGAMLVFMGYNTTRSSNKPQIFLDNDGLTHRYGSVWGGIMSSVSNPYFFIWWATIGMAFMFKGLEIAGLIGLVGFLIGHWSADLGWFSSVSFLSGKGAKIMTEKHYHLIMKICGIFLMVLGVYFLITAQMNNINSLIGP